jgi:catechol 2,3-dioxygenase-like lactoylglutathione lyase family enzyme
MPARINHIHIKASDPARAVAWWTNAFGFKVLSDETRPFGDRFIRCADSAGFVVVFSNARTGETLGTGSASAHFGLEHFAIEVDDITAEIERLQKLGAKFQEGPLRAPNGVLFAFLEAPDDVRLELVQLPK